MANHMADDSNKLWDGINKYDRYLEHIECRRDFPTYLSENDKGLPEMLKLGQI